MDVVADTRRSLHAVAETVLAGHQHRVAGTIRLAVIPDGFATLPLPGEPSWLAIRGTDLVVRRDDVETVHALRGSLGALAAAAGIEFGAPDGVYGDTLGAPASYELSVDPTEAAAIARAFELGDVAMRELGSRHHPDQPPVPVLWPEHFDVGISLDEVNYGVSAGDDAIAEPYAYVGPWKSRRGPFWDQPFGAARRIEDGADAAELVAFFEAGLRAAGTDPLQV